MSSFLYRLGQAAARHRWRTLGIWIAAVVAIFVVAAVVTPPDVVSQFMLALPMCLLYEAGLIFSRFIGRPKDVPQDSADPAH